MPWMSIDESGNLDWLDRLVLTQVQHTLGQSLTRDRSVGSSASAEMSLQDGNASGEKSTTSIQQLYSALLKRADALASASSSADVEKDEAREAALDSEVLLHMQDIATRTWQPKPLESDLDNFCCLLLELPMLSNVVIHDERQAADVTPHLPPRTLEEQMFCAVIRTVDAADPYTGGKVVQISTGTSEKDIANYDSNLSQAIFANNNLTLEFSVTDSRFTGGSLAVISDWDADNINLTEDQSRKLNFSTIRGNSNEKTKPNLEQKALLDKIVNSPLGVQQLTGSEKDMLYIYRYSLTDNQKSLVKFLLSIDWDVVKETEEVAKLLPLWQRNAPLDVAEALKLLGKERSFQNEMVRAYAVECVDAATDEELQLYLLQLVQALRYEPRIHASSSGSGSGSVSSSVPAGNNRSAGRGAAATTKKPSSSAGRESISSTSMQVGLGGYMATPAALLCCVCRCDRVVLVFTASMPCIWLLPPLSIPLLTPPYHVLSTDLCSTATGTAAISG